MLDLNTNLNIGSIAPYRGGMQSWTTDLSAAGGMYYDIPALVVGTEFEIEGEFYNDDTTGTEYIVSGTAVGDDEIVVRVNGSNLEFLAYVGTTLQTACSVSFTADVLHTFVAKVTGTTASLIINGGTPSTQTWALDGNQDIDNIGRVSSGSFFDGIIRNVKIWTGGDRTTGTLERFYKLNESTGTTIRNFASTDGTGDGTTVNITDAERELYRQDADGNWINKQWPNLFERSEEFENAYWENEDLTVSANATIAPNGSTTADELVEDATETATEHKCFHVLTSLDLTKNYTMSIYAKKNTRDMIKFFGFGNGSNGVVFDLTNGVFKINAPWESASIESVGNGWYRCIATVNPISSNFAHYGMATKLTGGTYMGDGTSGVYIWGAQIEEGTQATPYKPTTDTPGIKIEVA